MGSSGPLSGVSGAVDITPPTEWSVHLFGYTGRTEPASGVSDALGANALVVSDEQGRVVVLMTFDTLYVGPRLSERLKAFLRERSGIPEKDILLAASHTHFAPPLDDTKPGLGRVDERYLNWVGERCEGLLSELLAKSGAPLVFRTAEVRWDGAVFRRRRWPLPYFCGHKEIAWGQPVMAPNHQGPSERRVQLWLLYGREDERVLAAVWTCACHPTGKPDCLLISAEYCAHARQRLFEEIGYEVPVLFFQGFAGDQRPDVPERRGLWERIWRAALFGPSFATFDAASWSAWVGGLSSAIGAAFTAASAQAAVPAAGRIDTAFFQLPLPEIIDGDQNVSKSVTFQRISCSNMLELFCVSAEPSTQLRELIPFPGAVPVGYTGDVFGYWPTEQQRREGGYEGRRFFLDFGLNGRFRADLDAKFRKAAEKLAEGIAEWPAAVKRS